MKKLIALAKHILTLPGIDRDQIEAFADLGKLNPSGKDMGNGGIELGRFRYDAVISIERCPATIANLLLALLLVWLAENDSDRDILELSDPDIDVNIEDEQTVSVQITVEFDEALSMVADPDGNIAFNGEKYRLDDVTIDVAETLDSLEKT